MTFNKKIEFNNEKRLNEIVKVARKYKLGKLLISSSKRKSPDEFDESLDISNLRLAMEELGPAFIKLGQLLSTRPDFVGIEIAENLKKLRDDTPVTPFSEIKEVIESETTDSVEAIEEKLVEEITKLPEEKDNEIELEEHE